MKKFLLAPALAALAMFVFGAIYWMSPYPYKALGRVADDAAAGAALAKIFPATGAYLVPGPFGDEAKIAELMKRGPIAQVHFVANGMPMMDPLQLAKGYVHEFIICLLLALLLEKSAPLFQAWTCRAKYTAMLGLLLALYDYGHAIWWHHSVAWVTMQALYDFLAFVVAGLVLGKMLAPKVAAPPAVPTAG
ncbi:MAG: hypothetical protein HY736_07955 [Verrucomicrobia bacterium]|nr:hypothetical protein [Verrucomicrobiota bacterium]